MLAINGGVKLWYIEGITNMRYGKYRLFSEVQALDMDYDNASTLSGGFVDGIQGRKTIV